jgi:SAM-dependent methyltransferase
MGSESTGALLRTARERLYPSVLNPNYLVLRSRRMIFQNWINQAKGQGLTVLDIGGRYQPYRPLFEDRANRYIACDIQKTVLVDVIATGQSLPFASASCDVVVCTQVFEYFADPYAAAREIERVLKPGGILLMSVVGCAPRFVDEERWRYTPRGIRSILSSFSEVTIVPETSSVGGLLRTLNLGLNTLAHFGGLRAVLKVTLCPMLNMLGVALERAKLTNNDQFAPNYSVLAVKGGGCSLEKQLAGSSFPAQEKPAFVL